MPQESPIQIDLQAIVRNRLGNKARFVPRFLVRRLERLVCQDRLNALLRNNFPKRGAEFCRGVFADLGVTVKAVSADNLPAPSQRRVIIASNHPLGGLDGMALIAWLETHYGSGVKILVNDLLMAVEPLSDVFMPVNKHGAQSRRSIATIDDALAGNDPLVIFPAGLVSRRGDDGTIADLEWQKMFVAKAREFERDIVPVHFGGHNSDSFYKFARMRKRLGIKFNFEMMLLPREVFRSAGKTFTITCGKTIPWQALGSDLRAEAARIRRMVYAIAGK